MDIIQAIWEALAVGDAMGMPTEFMTQQDIDRIYPGIQGLLEPAHSLTHSNMPYGSVTDDTQQNQYLAFAYVRDRKISLENTVRALSDWIIECDAIGKKYIGPSSLKALDAIRHGGDPLEAGRDGTTCGAVMRTPALVLCAGGGSEDHLLACIRQGCLPTHNTSQAMEAAAAYGLALRAAIEGSSLENILESADRGGDAGMNSAQWIAAAPRCSRRLRRLEADIRRGVSDEALRQELYYVYGTGLASIDVYTAAMAVFLQKREDVFGGICLAASLGGDTDTIAALAGALCAAYAGGHNIPEAVLRSVLTENNLHLDALSADIRRTFW